VANLLFDALAVRLRKHSDRVSAVGAGEVAKRLPGAFRVEYFLTCVHDVRAVFCRALVRLALAIADHIDNLGQLYLGAVF
jgi:siroheme synthase (precorrin-2 oxidase/ferrochelatase)